MLSNSQQFRPCTFLIKLTKKIKMPQMTFTKYAAKQQKYISVCLQQQKPPPKSAAVLANQRSSQALQKELVAAGEWEEEWQVWCCLQHTSNSSLGQSKCSPSNVPALAKNTGKYWLVTSLWILRCSEPEEPYLWCLYRSLRGNKGRLNPPQLSTQWPLKSYISSNLTNRNQWTYFELICYEHFMQNYFLCFVMHNVMFIPFSKRS